MMEFRGKLDKIDDKILILLIERFNIISLIGKHKKENGIPVVQRDRIQEIVDKARGRAKEHGIKEGSFEKIYRSIIDESCLMEEEAE